jgi:lipopolysaccharide/colanic/teichoic acid biosynthesis glycosyltransferase
MGSSDKSWETQRYLFWKRVLDLVISLVALIVLFPLLLFIALLIKLDSPGPILFIQKRIGKAGCPIQIIKFRTLKQELDDANHRARMRAFVRGAAGHTQQETEALPKGNTDPDSQPQSSTETPLQSRKRIFKPFRPSQVTRVGRILRKTSLDELPQLLNVLAGNMSLVGPRPNVPWEVQEYQDWHRERLTVLPGITGLAQVNGRSAIDFDTIVKYDIEYIRNRNLWLDLKIMVRTIFQVLGGYGAH